MQKFFSLIFCIALCWNYDALAQGVQDPVSPTDAENILQQNTNLKNNALEADLSDDTVSDALEDLKNKAANGDVEAQLNLGYMYLYGVDGTAVDYKQALFYYEAAAKENNAVAYNNLGSLYFNGIGTDVDYTKAVTFFEKAAELGSHDAAVNLALIYLNPDQESKIKADTARVIELLQIAQADNNIAKYLLGYAYYKGFGLSKDNRKAFKLVKAAADAQYDEAQYILAQFYMKGIGTTKNYNRAIEYLQKATDQGNASATMMLANILTEGKIYTSDIKKAHILYNISAVMGEEGAAEKRDALEESLSIDDLLAVQAAAENYKPEPSELTSFVHQTFGESLKTYIDKHLNATIENNKGDKN